MNIIIVGAGEIGRHLAFCLAKDAHRISLIEADKALAEELEFGWIMILVRLELFALLVLFVPTLWKKY